MGRSADFAAENIAVARGMKENSESKSDALGCDFAEIRDHSALILFLHRS
jgi:hypothetical protein